MTRIEAAEKIKREFYGPDTDRNPRNLNDPDMAEISGNFALGDIESRGLLTPAEHELIIIACLTTLYYTGPVSGHAQVALAAGATPVEIRETVYQCAPYVGYPVVWGALAGINAVFEARGITLPLESGITVTEADRMEKGRELQYQLFGREAADAMARDFDPATAHIGEFLTGYCFGEIHTRGGMDLQTREMLTVCILTALGCCEPQLKAHLRAGLNIGIAREKLIEALTQCVPYVGFPKCLNAFRLLDEASVRTAEQAEPGI